MQGEGEDVLALPPGSGAPSAKPDAQVPHRGVATGMLQAGPAALDIGCLAAVQAVVNIAVVSCILQCRLHALYKKQLLYSWWLKHTSAMPSQTRSAHRQHGSLLTL